MDFRNLLVALRIGGHQEVGIQRAGIKACGVGIGTVAGRRTCAVGDGGYQGSRGDQGIEDGVGRKRIGSSR